MTNRTFEPTNPFRVGPYFALDQNGQYRYDPPQRPVAMPRDGQNDVSFDAGKKRRVVRGTWVVKRVHGPHCRYVGYNGNYWTHYFFKPDDPATFRQLANTA